jgi:hypothetical protein
MSDTLSAGELCGCMRCHRERGPSIGKDFTPAPGFRYACEICGNKPCPHHTDHRLACTNSNKPGQPGSVFR